MTDCIIVDDELAARNILKKYISNVPFLHLSGEFKNAMEAFSFLQKNKVDLLFLDIEMPQLSGIHFAKIIGSDANIIFTTAHREFAVEGFELNAIDYLLKPFSFNRFLAAIKKCVKNDTSNTSSLLDKYMYIRTNKKMVKVKYADFLFIEGMGNYIKVHLSNRTLITYEKMSAILEALPENEFVRIHKSYIVNVSRIETFTREYVEIGKRHLRIGGTFRNNFLNRLK